MQPTTEPAAAYRDCIRRTYELAAAARAAADLDERFRLWDAQAATAAVAGAIALEPAEKAAIDAEEFTRAFPKVRNTVRTGKANPWSHRTSGRVAR